MGQYISSQNEKLDTQNKIMEEEIKDNKKSVKQAFWTAVGSIAVAILATIWSIWVTYDIYDKTDKSDKDNQRTLLKHMDKNNIETSIQKQTRVLNNIEQTIKQNNIIYRHEKINSEKQIEVLNKILKATEKNDNKSKGNKQ
jgi:hypothetical protein